MIGTVLITIIGAFVMFIIMWSVIWIFGLRHFERYYQCENCGYYNSTNRICKSCGNLAFHRPVIARITFFGKLKEKE